MSTEGDRQPRQTEVDEEPASGVTAASMGVRATTLPLPTTAPKEKINLMLITIEPFNGEVPDGHVDAGAYDWLETLKVQIELGETLNNRTWPEKIKCGILASRLSGSAATWYTRNRATLPIASFRDLGNAFLEQFRCRLPIQQQAVRLAQNKKFPAETYLAYSHRLSVCAAGLNRGKVNNFTEQQALCTFINHAYPTFRDTMLAKLDVEAEDASTELQAAVDLVTKLANSDGRLRKRYADEYGDSSTADKKPRQTVAAAATATSTKSSRSRWDFSQAICRTCGQKDHTTNYHDRFVAQQKHAGSAARGEASSFSDKEEQQ